MLINREPGDRNPKLIDYLIVGAVCFGIIGLVVFAVIRAFG